MNTLSGIEKYEDIMRRHRRALHRIPECDFDLKKTASYILNVLKDMHCEVTRAARCGICAYFDFDKNDTFAFRSDMDALPITEKTALPFSSANKGFMHACGHDGHMSMMLGFADWLENADKAVMNCNVLLVFQPAEETTGGAKLICESGVFEKYGVERIYGIHLWPDIAKGAVSSCPGPMMARSSEINIDARGKTAHCTAADRGLDSILASAKLIANLEEMPELEKTGSILKFGRISGGTVRNAIAASCRTEGTLRCLTSDAFDSIIGKMNDLAMQHSKSSGCSIIITHSDGYWPVTNDAALYEKARSLLGDDLTLCKPAMISEDFSFYQKIMPGLFFFLGTGTGIPLHSDTFNFDEKILLAGLSLYIRLTSE